MEKNKYILGLFAVLTLQAFSQDVLVVDGGNIHVTANGLITVQGSVLNQNSGQIDNSGNINVTGDWTNNGGNSMLVNNSAGTVILDGSNQNIKGSDVTDFYNLNLEGNSTVKTMELDANVANRLSLGDAELQTNANTVYVNNPSVNAIAWNTGYVNSDSLGGYLSRATNSINEYVFPVGSSLLSDNYRAVTLVPNSAATNSFGVRLSDEDPGLDNSGTSYTGDVGPFSRTVKAPKIREINSGFYYNIARLSGASGADIKVDFFTSDGSFQTLTKWDGTKWDELDVNYASSTAGAALNSPDVELTKVANVDFSHDVYALAELEFEIGVPGGVSNNSDGFNDFLEIENLEYYPENELVIFNRWGDIVYKSKPYLNDWNGQVNGSMVLSGDKVSDGTFFYILKLSEDETIEPLKGSLELRSK